MRTDYSASSAAAQQVFSMNNGAPFDFFEFFDQIVDSSADAYEKLIALILARHVGKNSEAAFPARARILQKASCSLATFKRSQAALAAFFNPQERSGRSTLYAPKPLITASDVEFAILAARAEQEAQKKPIKKETWYPTEPGPGVPQIPGADRTRVPTASPPGIPQTPHNDSSKITTLHWRTREGQDALTDKLLAACNGAAANPAVAPGILVLSEPIKWLESGCDLELDILPTVKARAHKLRPGSIKNWSYFTDAIADAKAAREAPMPKGSPGAATAKPGKPQGNYSFSGEYIGRRL